MSVLHFAVDQSDEYLLRSLLTKGRVSPNFQDLRPSVLPLAVQRDLPSDFIELLVEHGADVNHFGIIDQQKTTALMEAALHRRWGIYEYLVEHGADVNSPNAEHGSPFTYVVCCGYEQMAQMSVSHGAGVNLPVAPYGTALIAAANAKQWKMVQWLLERGADTLPTSQQFGTALTQASWYGDLSTVELLLQHQADVNGDGGLYGSALIAAASESHWDIVKALLEKGANPETPSTFYGSALIQAARHGNITIAELLCTFGVVPSKDGTSGPYSQGFPTPLMAATYYNHIDMVVWLVDHGADVNRIAQHSGKAGNTLKTALDMTDENLGAIDGSKNNRDGESFGGKYMSKTFSRPDCLYSGPRTNAGTTKQVPRIFLLFPLTFHFFFIIIAGSSSLDSLTTDGEATTAHHNSGEQRY
ncbi:ankyrin repeat-containing domain protein [Flagelloscypha sp. PMI_526]|nr:ankyrin repeat-containing domain protein [Flagelloscypha sp. PMI_526]